MAGGAAARWMSAAPAAAFFALDYATARAKFLAAAEVAGLDVQSHLHPLLGRDGELLAMDVVRDGARDAAAVLIVSSGCHGVEGYCGSGVQGFLLQDAGFREAARAAGVAVLHVHALNPYGFSWRRRVTQENVDLNRNFHDFAKPLPANAGYDELSAAILPTVWPPPAEATGAIDAYLQAHGAAALQRAITGGQYRHPEGVFYGGRNPTWSHLTLRHVLREHATRCARLGWIDLHTGLGPNGLGERIFACVDDAAALRRARAWWGGAVTSIYDGSSSSSPLQGLMWNVVYEECAQAQYTGIALEYGTLPLAEMLVAVRADQWLENHPDTDDARRDTIKRQVFEAFFTDTDEWKSRILEQALDAAHGGVRGLAGVSD